MGIVANLAIAKKYSFLGEYVEFGKAHGEVRVMDDSFFNTHVDWDRVFFLDANGKTIRQFGSRHGTDWRSKIIRFCQLPLQDFGTSYGECFLLLGKRKSEAFSVLVLIGDTHKNFTFYIPPPHFHTLEEWSLSQA